MNRNKMKIYLRFFALLIIVFVIFAYFFDKSRIQNNKNPVFTFFTINYKDGGTEYKIGIGYSIIMWHQNALISLNNTEIYGINIGTEFVKFPLCYFNIFNHYIKPKIELQFVPKDNFIELYEIINNEYFNIKIIRNENHGLMNIIPCNVFIYNENMELINYDNLEVFNMSSERQINRNKNDYFLIIGGETAFLKLHSGKYSLKIITPKENQMKYLEEYEKDWESMLYDFQIEFEKYEEIKILPGGDDSYNGTWIIE